MRTAVRLALIAASTAFPALASAQTQTAPALPIFDFAQSGVTFQTGDTWSANGQTFRLYGVQSCIRGTFLTNAARKRTDCGEASVAYLAALVHDAKPRCTAIAQAGAPPVIFTVCAAHVGSNTLDLGTALITQGFAFAATDATGKPTKFEYAVAESEASKAKRGLWASPDLPHPSRILMNAARGPRRQ
ncbi:MAG: succinoglycan biosynthesis protein exoi [Novosphingobium sp.]|nr:succinoglycan biosynthesis protein exoi [Novosphingobium sp.]